MATIGVLTRNYEVMLVLLSGSYRRGHYVVQEYTNVQNKHCPTFPWEVRNLHPEVGQSLTSLASTR